MATSLADFDDNGQIDYADMNHVGANIGMTGATWSDGDLDGDGEVTLNDFDMASAQYFFVIVWVL